MISYRTSKCAGGAAEDQMHLVLNAVRRKNECASRARLSTRRGGGLGGLSKMRGGVVKAWHTREERWYVEGTDLSLERWELSGLLKLLSLQCPGLSNASAAVGAAPRLWSRQNSPPTPAWHPGGDTRRSHPPSAWYYQWILSSGCTRGNCSPSSPP